jgi:hypothetical protein
MNDKSGSLMCKNHPHVKAFYHANKKGFCSECRAEAVLETKREYREPKSPLWVWDGGHAMRRRDQAVRSAE